MSHRINIIVNDATWEALQRIPKGDRSRFIESAVLEQLQKKDRRKAFAAIDRIRREMKPVAGCSEDWIRKQRNERG